MSKWKDTCPHCGSEDFEMVGDPEYNDLFCCNNCGTEFGSFKSVEVTPQPNNTPEGLRAVLIKHTGGLQVSVNPFAMQDLYNFVSQAIDQKIDSIVGELPNVQNHPSYSDPTVRQLVQTQYDQGWNDLHWQVKSLLQKHKEANHE